jgi:hypothetical protein
MILLAVGGVGYLLYFLYKKFIKKRERNPYTSPGKKRTVEAYNAAEMKSLSESNTVV